MSDSPGDSRPQRPGDLRDGALNPQDIRREYTRGELREADVCADPIEQFARWFDDAQAAQVPDVNAMALATADVSGFPSARIVLLKEFDPRGFVFFTNYESQKGRELALNPRASLCFYWSQLERQVRIAGTVQRISSDESQAYFQTRPFAAQVSAWASPQSRTISSRAQLEQREADLLEKFKGRAVPLPEFWGGYRLIPLRIEFWQGRASRLHDRLRYTRSAPDAKWIMERLAP